MTDDEQQTLSQLLNMDMMGQTSLVPTPGYGLFPVVAPGESLNTVTPVIPHPVTEQ